jgi:hypothetical protein
MLSLVENIVIAGLIELMWRFIPFNGIISDRNIVSSSVRFVPGWILVTNKPPSRENVIKISVVIALVSIHTARHTAHFLLQTLPVAQTFVTKRCTVSLFGTSLSRYSPLNAWRRAVVRKERVSANEFSTFAPAQLL